MIRRLLVYLLITAYTAGQLAVVPHSHVAGMEPPGHKHDGRAHFHVGDLAHGHSHDHKHSHDHNSHQPSGHALPSCDDLQPERTHAGDAIYIPDASVAPNLGEKVTLDLETPVIALANPSDAILSADEFVQLGRPDFWDDCHRSCNLYLILRALRI